jgi:tRNA(Ile)-lysidine synthase
VRGLTNRPIEATSLGADAFDRRLDPASTAPIAVAVSGGGDSIAAMILTVEWARRHHRRVLVLNVDHGLQAASGEWAGFAEAAAGRAGASFRALAWTGAKPAHGLPAAARAARHRLIAMAAREAGARVVVFGHTADDVLEAARMREAGLRVGGPREWSPSPVWPEGEGLFLLRPLIAVRRAAIRTFLAQRREAWIDDPANDDPASPRTRARQGLASCEAQVLAPAYMPEPAELASTVEVSPFGFLRIDRRGFRRAPPLASRRCLGAAVLCVGGGERPPAAARLDRLVAAVLDAAPLSATLAGARIIGEETLLVVRDAGEAGRGGLAPMSLRAGERAVWDGRFEVVGTRDAVTVRALAGWAARLSPAERRALGRLPAPVRPGLPIFLDDGGTPQAAILSDLTGVSMRSLVADRFLAACGAISKEPAT